MKLSLKIRKLHRLVAISLSPFIIFLSLTGCVLLFRKAGIYEKEIKNLLVELHTWEILAPYIGIFLGIGLLFLAISGIILFFNPRA